MNGLATRADWQRFARYLLLGAGAGFLLSGLVFFFAYNWEGLHRFVKIGTVSAVFAGAGLFGIFAPVGRLARGVAHTAAVGLIGVLFAVLGQVYQTGADSYTLFLSWTVCALPWVALVYFAPLWAGWVMLLNVTFLTYVAQVDAPFEHLLINGLLLFTLNLAAWLIVYFLWRHRASFSWLPKLIAVWMAGTATLNLSIGTIDEPALPVVATIVLVGVTYVGWLVLGLRARSIFYPALVGAAALVTFIFLLLRWTQADTGTFLLAGLLALAGMTTLAHFLNRLNQRWHAID